MPGTRQTILERGRGFRGAVSQVRCQRRALQGRELGPVFEVPSAVSESEDRPRLCRVVCLRGEVRGVRAGEPVGVESKGRSDLQPFDSGAKELVGKEGGDPRVVLAAALLLDIAKDEPSHTDGADKNRTCQTDGLRKANDILRRMGLDEDTSRRVCQILCGYRTGHDLDTIEFKIVCDAERLARLAAENTDKDRGELQNLISRGLRTETARARARELFQD
jgi:hypothetical protein